MYRKKILAYINWACYRYAEPREKSKKDKLSKRKKKEHTYQQTNKQTAAAATATSKNRKKRTTHHHSQQQQQQSQDKNISRQLLLLFLTLLSLLDSYILYVWPLTHLVESGNHCWRCDWLPLLEGLGDHLTSQFRDDFTWCKVLTFIKLMMKWHYLAWLLSCKSNSFHEKIAHQEMAYCKQWTTWNFQLLFYFPYQIDQW